MDRSKQLPITKGIHNVLNREVDTVADPKRDSAVKRTMDSLKRMFLGGADDKDMKAKLRQTEKDLRDGRVITVKHGNYKYRKGVATRRQRKLRIGGNPSSSVRTWIMRYGRLEVMLKQARSKHSISFAQTKEFFRMCNPKMQKLGGIHPTMSPYDTELLIKYLGGVA